jgi:hypothetical protein
MSNIGPWQIVVLVLFFLIFMLPTVIAIVDIFRSKFKDDNKYIWLLIVVFLNFLGVILYFAIGRKRKIVK